MCSISFKVLRASNEGSCYLQIWDSSLFNLMASPVPRSLLFVILLLLFKSWQEWNSFLGVFVRRMVLLFNQFMFDGISRLFEQIQRYKSSSNSVHKEQHISTYTQYVVVYMLLGATENTKCVPKSSDKSSYLE